MMQYYLPASARMHYLLRLSVFGIACATGVVHVSAAPPSLYDLMRNVTRMETSLDVNGNSKVEVPVKKFTAKIRSDAINPVLRSNVDAAIGGVYLDACDATQTDAGTCITDVSAGITRTVSAEERVRTLGRDLQIIASGYEATVASKQDDSKNLATHYRGIIRIWQAGTGSVKSVLSGSIIRSVTLPEASGEPAINATSQALRALILRDDTGAENREQFTAAVWRYQHGVRFIRGERGEIPPPPVADVNGGIGTERQYLFQRFDGVENGLKQLWDAAVSAPMNPPLRPGESAIVRMTTHPLEDVAAWAYLERLRDGSLTGDAGLEWKIAVEPVLPSLCRAVGTEDAQPADNNCQPILGGQYPPVPKQSSAFCKHPFQKFGYLCRGVSSQNILCKQKPAPIAGQIVLAACSIKEGTGATLAGPDACWDMSWKKNAVPFNPDTQCNVKIQCGQVPFDAKTTIKSTAGEITITVNETVNSTPTYLMLHELTHAAQLCDLPVSVNKYMNDVLFSKLSATGSYPPSMLAKRNDMCCTTEGEAYRRQCEAMAADGMFPPGSSYNVETCWQILTDGSCRERGYGACPNTYSFTQSNGSVNTRFRGLLTYMANNVPAGMPKTCSETLKNGVFSDPRIDAGLREVNSLGKKVCDPNMATTYDNTIGANMCFIDQCIEQSVEYHRLNPGRMTLTSGDAAFPFEMCASTAGVDDALRGVPPPTAIPPYRPALLINQLDSALCQAQGLPPATPPVLCSFEATRRLFAPLQEAYETSLDLLNQTNEGLLPVQQLQNLSQALGSRIGAELYDTYLEVGGRRLTEVTTRAADLLTKFKTVTFSADMCPFADTGKGANTLQACLPPKSSSSASP